MPGHNNPPADYGHFVSLIKQAINGLDHVTATDLRRTPYDCALRVTSPRFCVEVYIKPGLDQPKGDT